MITANRNLDGVPAMELDLDTLLRSHGATSDDDEGSSCSPSHRRTVDEILNGPSSSPSPSPPDSPRAVRIGGTTTEENQVPVSSSLADASSSASWRSAGSREQRPLRLRLRSADSALPPLFGAVRPSMKPGSALAAAAAASRSVLTPHAAAIKSRRSLHSQGEMSELSTGLEVLDYSDIPDAVPSEANLEALGTEPAFQTFKSEERIEISYVEVASQQLESENDVLLSSKSSLETDITENKADHIVDPLIQLQDTSGDVVEDIISDSCDVEDEKMGNDMVDFDYEKAQNQGSREITQESDIGYKIDMLVEERLNQLEDEKKAEKKLRASMKALEWAEEIEKRNASSRAHSEEGAVSQPMRLEGIRQEPPAIGYLQIDLDNAVTRTVCSQSCKNDHGSPLVVAVHMNFIAVGMSKGAVLIYSSKYLVHSPDNMDSKMLTFSSHGEKSSAPVTSICFNQHGDMLLAGYGDGRLTIWDLQRSAAAKVIIGEHTTAVVHALFLGQDSQVTRQFKCVTGDSRGLVLLHTFSVVPLLNRFSNKSQCLLDGQKTGTVLSASSILINNNGTGCMPSQVNSVVSSSGLGNMVGGVVGGESTWKLFNEGSSFVEEGVVVFVTHQNALVVRLSPSMEVYEKFSKPEGVREGCMPYTAWKCTSYSHGSGIDKSDKASWLVIVWDRRVQVCKLVKSDMNIVKEWNIDNEAIGVAWLDDQMLVILTVKGEFCLFTKDGSELNRTSFVVDGSGLDDIITYHTHFSNAFGNPEKTYHNSVAVRGASIYIVGPTHLIVSRILLWRERIQVLQRAGDWMGALDMAMRLFDGQALGVIDLPATVDSIRNAIMPYLVDLIASYVDEVFSYISVASANQIGMGLLEATDPSSALRHSDIEEKYASVGGVAVEFCVHIKRSDILFDDIFCKFTAVQQKGTFLEILEPYILKDMLGCLPPEVMQALVEHYSGKGWLQRVEQCVLHMDISSLDFNQVAKLCRENGLYGALIYIFNRGLDDFRTPLEELLMVVQSGQGTNVAAVGYKMLVYLKYCFLGLAYPPGHGDLSSSRLLSVKKELLQLLLEDSKSSISLISSSFRSYYGACPNICYLLWLDTEATFDVLRCAFKEEGPQTSRNSLHDLDSVMVEQEKDDYYKRQNDQKVMVQGVTSMLISIFDLEADNIRTYQMDDQAGVWPSQKDLGYLLEFLAFVVTKKEATIPACVLNRILEYMTSFDALGLRTKDDVQRKEEEILSLLKVVPETDWSYPYVLHLCVSSQFYQVCGFLYAVQGQYVAALDSYIKDLDKPIHAFAFIDNMMLQLKDTEASSFCSAVLAHLPELVKLSRECAFILVIDCFHNEIQHIMSELQSYPESLFLFLKTAIDAYLSGTNSFSIFQTTGSSYVSSAPSLPSIEVSSYLQRLANFQQLPYINAISITDEITELYLKLLCQYERDSVLKFLETFENYRVESCLRLCQEYGITDASAFLFERVGDVGNALVLLMSGLREKFFLLRSSLERVTCKMHSSIFFEVQQVEEIVKLDEVIAVQNTLHACIGLCQRNTQRLDPQESESLWFQLLDSFSDPLRMLYSEKLAAEQIQDKLPAISGIRVSEESLSLGKFSTSDKCNILRKLFSQFLGDIIESMREYVSLSAIMEKLISDNGNQEFGDFKFTILRMLETYGYETRILDAAKSLIEDDAFYTMSLLKKGACHAYAPQNWVCCICNCPIYQGPSTSGIRIFSCGHSTHTHCEFEESESVNRGASAGCPICLSKINPHSRNKSVLESGLVYTKQRSEISRRIANVQHLHEPDAVEKTFSLQQMPRFEMLSNLHRNNRGLHVDTVPQLRLSPPAIYHEKVRKGGDPLIIEASHAPSKTEKHNKRWPTKEPRPKGSLSRFPRTSSIFGPEKNKIR